MTVLHTSFSVPLVNLRATHSTDTSAAVSDADISIIIEIEQSKHPGNLILPKSADPAAPPASGCLWLGGYQACRAPFLQARKITVVLNVAKSLEKFYPAWGKEVAQLEAEKGLLQLMTPSLLCSSLHSDVHSSFHSLVAAITVRRVLWIDDTNQEIPVAELVELCRWIHTSLQRANVLVHCAQGKSRSATAVLAYVMVINNVREISCLFLSLRAIAAIFR